MTIDAVVVTVAVAAFAIGAWIAVEGERQDRKDRAKVCANRLYRRAWQVIDLDRKEAKS